MRGVFTHRFPTAEAPNLAAQGQSVSRKTVAEVPLTGLSLILSGRLVFSKGMVVPGYNELAHER
jgi:hypothetical protein